VCSRSQLRATADASRAPIGRSDSYRGTVRTERPPRSRPSPLQWLWYALGGGLPRELAPWVLADTTRRTWVWRHLARALVQLTPLLVICVVLVPVPLTYRLSAAAGGVILGLLFSLAYMTETTEHRAVKAGYPPGTTARTRAERAERERIERRARYRRDGAGSFD
jgi:Family of unknown function (DUF5313)